MPLIDTRGIKLWFEETGAETAPAIVLGHSFLCSTTMWRSVVPALEPHYRVINIDLRGHGKSGEITEPFTLYDGVADVVAVLDHLAVQRAVWCGLSIGGMVALRAALTNPGRVSKLVLLDTDAGAESAVHKLKYGAMGLGARILGIDPFLSPIARLMFGTHSLRCRAALVRGWRAECAALHLPSVLRCLDALMARDSLLDRLPSIHAPTLVLVGEDDRSLPPVLSRRIEAGIPGAELIEIPRAGHLSALEEPETVSRAIVEFLERT
jgi:pimeloyl-ACP methyl ester carboxylesterase